MIPRASLDAVLELNKPEDEDNYPAYQPGESLRGRATLRAAEGWNADFADIMLFWRTEGKGTPDEGVAATLSLVQTRGEPVPATLDREFNFIVPEYPWTYHGKVLKIHWYVGLYAQGSGRREAKAEREIMVKPVTRKP